LDSSISGQATRHSGSPSPPTRSAGTLRM
jgi:hypothetical protein